MSNEISLLDKLEEALKAGNIALVHDELNSLKASKLKRSEVLKFANIARRAGYHRTAIKLLYPIVRSVTDIKPTGDEKAEYAMCLSRAGALAEAHALLDEVDPKEAPESLLYKAFCYFSSWDYHLSIPLLEKYLQAPQLTDHQMTVAQINLADAYFTEGRYEDSVRLCQDVLKKIDLDKEKLNAGYIHQILGQSCVLTKKFDEAENHFQSVEKLIGNSHYRYHLYLRKWRAILKCYKAPDKKNLEALREVSEQAQAKRVWEVARECDFYQALIFEDQGLFWKVYFTTPYLHYRDRMLKISKYSGEIPTSYDLVVNGNKGTPNQIFDVREGRVLGTNIRLKTGQLVHRLFATLCSDFYKSFRVETLFSLLFPDELYNLKKSSYKVHDTMARLRSWLLENNLPFSIDEDDSHYRLRISEPFVLRLIVRQITESSIENFVVALRESFNGHPFKIQDVINLESHPRSTAKWLLTKAVDQGLLERVGQGRGVKYKFSA